MFTKFLILLNNTHKITYVLSIVSCFVRYTVYSIKCVGASVTEFVAGSITREVGGQICTGVLISP
jgi:hypothetical protein